MHDTSRSTAHVGNGWRILLMDLGLDAFAVLRRAGQPATLFDGGGTHISLDELWALYAAIEAESDDPTLALKAGQTLSIELFDPAMFAAICSPNLNTATRRLGQFKRLVGAFSLDVEVGEDTTHVGYRCKHRADLPRIMGTSELIFLVALARRATRHPVHPRRFMVQAMPEDRAPFEDYLGCEVEVGDTYTVSFAARDAARPFLTHNAQMWEAFEPGLRRRMAQAEASRSTTEQVQTALFELLPSGRTHMTDVAKELGVGARTLQRRLADEDTTWLEVLNQTRERLARHYLGSTRMSPTEVSFLLGFEDPNSLFRAFHRWTGTSPEAWRAQQRATTQPSDDRP